ncbi:MAG: hypothetical protein ACRD2G_11520 [Terriglobia bacterium]
MGSWNPFETSGRRLPIVPAVDGYVSVANTTGSPVEVRLRATDAHGAPRPGMFLQLASHTAKVLHL